jgi:hypothetical protein
MAGKKWVTSEEILLNDDSDKDLIPVLETSDSEDESQEIGMGSNMRETSGHAIPDSLPSYCPTAPSYTANVGLNIEQEHRCHVLCECIFTEEFFQYVCVTRQIFMLAKS